MQRQKFNDLETGTLGEGLNRRALLACPTKRYRSLSWNPARSVVWPSMSASDPKQTSDDRQDLIPRERSAAGAMPVLGGLDVISDVPVRGLQHEDRSGKLGFTSVANVRRDKDTD